MTNSESENPVSGKTEQKETKNLRARHQYEDYSE